MLIYYKILTHKISLRPFLLLLLSVSNQVAFVDRPQTPPGCSPKTWHIDRHFKTGPILTLNILTKLNIVIRKPNGNNIPDTTQ